MESTISNGESNGKETWKMKWKLGLHRVVGKSVLCPLYPVQSHFLCMGCCAGIEMW